MTQIGKPHITTVRGIDFLLFAEKAALIIEHSTLLVADVHLGKGNHFRKHGIAVPPGAEDESLERLSKILNFAKPERVIFMGDLFHSQVNKSWNRFEVFLKDYVQCEMILVKGNHDILPDQLFLDANFQIVSSLELGPFLFTHDRCSSELYNIYGHIHPSVRLRGLGRSSLKLPCFIFSEDSAVLPSFGAFTGLASVRPGKTDKVFVINRESVIDVSAGHN
jgi:DNA ligase-associated metallophosphoesterase